MGVIGLMERIVDFRRYVNKRGWKWDFQIYRR